MGDLMYVQYVCMYVCMNIRLGLHIGSDRIGSDWIGFFWRFESAVDCTGLDCGRDLLDETVGGEEG